MMRTYLKAILLIVLMRSSVSEYSGDSALRRLIPTDAAICCCDASAGCIGGAVPNTIQMS